MEEEIRKEIGKIKDALFNSLFSDVPIQVPQQTMMVIGLMANKIYLADYRIVKAQPKPERLLPCTCGHNRRTRWFTPKGMYYECKKCGYKSQEAENGKALREQWNKEMRALTDGKRAEQVIIDELHNVNFKKKGDERWKY